MEIEPKANDGLDPIGEVGRQTRERALEMDRSATAAVSRPAGLRVPQRSTMMAADAHAEAMANGLMNGIGNVWMVIGPTVPTRDVTARQAQDATSRNAASDFIGTMAGEPTSGVPEKAVRGRPTSRNGQELRVEL